MRRTLVSLTAQWRRAACPLPVPLSYVSVSPLSAALVSSSVAHRSGAVATALVCAGRSASTDQTQTPPQSAVNVEEFTLNDEVVRKDLETLAKWNALSEAIDAAREQHNSQGILDQVAKGLSLLEKVGPSNAPIQCEALLCMEGAQAHCNLAQYDEALALAQRARDFLLDCKEELRDMAQIAEVRQYMGYVLYRQGKADVAHAMYTDVLRWIDVDAKTAMPMQAVAAVNLRRSVVSGVGKCTALQARQLAAKGEESAAEAKEKYGKALDILIEGLNAHIDENDFHQVKSTLEAILECFEGVGDVEQAVTTCSKYISWCSRHEDEGGIVEGRKMMEDLCARTGAENPLTKETGAETEKAK